MSDVIPSFYSQRVVGSQGFYSGGLMSNIKLRQGQVVKVVNPKDEESISKKFYEYVVVVSHYESGALGHKKYQCLLMNPLAGGGDQAWWTLRGSTVPIGGDESGKTNPYPAGVDGSRVLILCVEGSNNQAVIIGGLRDERSGGDDEKLGHHYEFEFNGVNFQVKDDGSFVLEQKGKTDNLGKAEKNRNEKAGTSIEVKPEGTLEIATKDNKQSITIDNTNDTITINAKDKITINGERINLGEGAKDPAVLGKELVAIMKEMLIGIQSMTMFSIAGAPVPLTSPPINAPLFASISARLDSILSSQTYLKS